MFTPEFAEFLEYLLAIIGFGVFCFLFGNVTGWTGAWLLVGFLDFFTDEIKHFKSKFINRRRRWTPPLSPPERYLSAP